MRAGLTHTRVCAGARGGRPALTHGRKLRPAGPQHLIWPGRAPPAPRRAPRDGEGQHRGSPDVPALPAVRASPARSALCERRAATGCAAPEGGRRLWAGTRRGGKRVGGRGSRRPTACCRLAAESPPRRPIEGRGRPSRCPAANAGRCRRRRRPAPSRCVSASVRRRSRVVLLFSWGTRCAMCYLRRNSRRRRQQQRQQQRRSGSLSSVAGTPAGEDAGRPPAAPAA